MSAKDVVTHALNEYYSDSVNQKFVVRTLLSQYRDEILSKLAGEIREKFPDPNPLASIFKPYVGKQIADYIDPED